MKMVIEASDKRSGMSMDELEQAVHQARNLGYHKLGKALLGFKSQLQSITFEKEEASEQS